jgi:hypothetical protein
MVLLNDEWGRTSQLLEQVRAGVAAVPVARKPNAVEAQAARPRRCRPSPRWVRRPRRASWSARSRRRRRPGREPRRTAAQRPGQAWTRGGPSSLRRRIPWGRSRRFGTLIGILECVKRAMRAPNSTNIYRVVDRLDGFPATDSGAVRGPTRRRVVLVRLDPPVSASRGPRDLACPAVRGHISTALISSVAVAYRDGRLCTAI